jgi:hypothetical protein
MITGFLVLARAYWLPGAVVQGIRLRALPRLVAADPESLTRSWRFSNTYRVVARTLPAAAANMERRAA